MSSDKFEQHQRKFEQHQREFEYTMNKLSNILESAKIDTYDIPPKTTNRPYFKCFGQEDDETIN